MSDRELFIPARHDLGVVYSEPEVGKGAWSIDDVLVHGKQAGIEAPAAYVDRLADAGLIAVVEDRPRLRVSRHRGVTG